LNSQFSLFSSIYSCINSINYRHSTHKNGSFLSPLFPFFFRLYFINDIISKKLLENTIEEEDEKEKIKDEPISIPLPTDPLELLKMIDSQNQPEFDYPV